MKRFYGVMGIASIITAILYWWLYKDTPMIIADTGSYINFPRNRTPGYPAFLWLFNTIFGNYNAIPCIQFLALFTGIWYLTVQFYALSHSFWLSISLWILLAANVELVKYAFILMTESLAMTLLIFMLCFLCRFVSTRSMCNFGILSALLGLAIVIRPAAYGWIFGLPFAAMGVKIFMPEISYKKTMKMLILPLLGILLMCSTFNYYRHGFFNTESIMGDLLIGKAGLLVDKNIPSQQPHALAIMADYASPVQEAIKKSPNWQTEYAISAIYVNRLLNAPFLTRLQYSMLEDNQFQRSSDELSIELGAEIIRAKPLAYLRSVLMNYIALWQVWGMSTPSEVPKIMAFFDKVPALRESPYFIDYRQRPDYTPPSWIALPLRVGMLWVFGASLWALISFTVRFYRHQPISPALYLMAVSSGFVQGTYLLTALIEVGIARYFLLAWPAIALVGVCSLWCIVNYSLQKCFNLHG